MSFGQYAIPCVYARGGSSKALLLKKHDIPSPGPTRDKVLLRLIGSPDPIQIDGMGGSRVVTSKIAIVSTSDREDADVDYEFCQCGVETGGVNYTGNCGNISSSIGPFAIDEGLITKPFRKGVSPAEGILTREVRIWQVGTKKLLVSHVPVDEATGKSVSKGDFEISAVPGTGAPILMDFSNTIGASRNKGALPTTHTRDTLTLQDKEVEVTVCDVANIIAYVSCKDMGISGSETAHEINADKALIARVKELRGKAAQLVGMCDDWKKVDEQSPGLPMVCMVTNPDAPDGDLRARLLLNNSCHDSMAGTAAICITACSQIQGSIVNQFVKPEALKKDVLNIQHPLGFMPVWVNKATSDPITDLDDHTFDNLSFVRTSRRIMEGVAYVPVEVWDGNKDRVDTRNGTSKNPPQTNGHVNGVKKDSPAEAIDTKIPVTKLLAEFSANTKFSDLPTTVVQGMKTYVLDYIGNGAYGAQHADSSASVFRAVQAFGVGSTGSSTVFTKGQKFAAPYAALLNATFAHSLDFDDTFQAGNLHAGVTCVTAALAQAEMTPVDGEQFLTAVAVGYEVICRVGRALGPGAYERGFHNTSTAGIFGAVAAAGRVKGLDAKTIEVAFGMAGSQAAGSMQYLATGAWNKKLHPGFATHNALLSIALAEAGVDGAVSPIEGKYGLLHGYSTSSTTLGLVDDLGKEWCATETSIKPYPGCRATHGAIDLAAKMRIGSQSRGVRKLKLTISNDVYDIVGAPLPNKVHPKNIVDAQFSVIFQVAAAWLHGNNLGLDLYHHLSDRDVNDLTERVVTEADKSLTGLATKLTVEWDDGSESTESVAKTQVRGEPANPMTMDKVVEKFMSLAVPVYGSKKAEEIASLVDHLDTCENLTQLASLVA